MKPDSRTDRPGRLADFFSYLRISENEKIYQFSVRIFRLPAVRGECAPHRLPERQIERRDELIACFECNRQDRHVGPGRIWQGGCAVHETFEQAAVEITVSIIPGPDPVMSLPYLNGGDYTLYI